MFICISRFQFHFYLPLTKRIPRQYCGRDPPANAGGMRDAGLIPGLGRSPGEGNDNPLQHSRLENSMDRGSWWAIVHGISKESDITKHTCTPYPRDICEVLRKFMQLSRMNLYGPRRTLSCSESTCTL